MTPMRRDAATALGEKVFCEGTYKRFGEMTVADARLRSEELREAGGWGPLAKVAAVAFAWRELASEMTSTGAATVAELDEPTALEYAKRVWVVPPRGSLL